MGRTAILLGTIYLLGSGSAFAQAGAPHGTVDISNSDMAPHDSATQPSNLDVIRNGIRNNDVDRTARYMRDKLGPARPADARELKAGAAVNDNQGAPMATIISVDPDGVVVASGPAKVKVPANAFGHNRAGLLLDMSKAQFEQIVAKANAAS